MIMNRIFVLIVLLAASNLATCDTKNNNNKESRPKRKEIITERNHETSDDEFHMTDTDTYKYKKRVKIARKKWKKTFEEIRSIVVDPTTDSHKKGSKLFDKWKLYLDGDNQSSSSTDTNGKSYDSQRSKHSSESTKPQSRSLSSKRVRQRFDGFATWEKLRQQWADDAANYSSKDALDQGSNVETGKSVSLEADVIMTQKSKKIFSPRPAQPGDKILPHTDIGDKSKKIWIITTASMPWMTGTAVNPLLRAAFMTNGRKEAGGKVTLMLPWLEQEGDRDKVYGKERGFDTQEEQEVWVRNWLKEKARLEEASQDLNISWYIGWLEPLENSIYSMGDITAIIPDEEVDICVLEEPEHLNWYRAPGESWTRKFKHVVGIVHTNYFVYAQEQPAAFLRAPGMKLLTSWMCRAHCHRIIKLSGTLGKFAPEKELVENVHGVRSTFLDYGVELSERLKTPKQKSHPVFGPDAEPKVYFIGKMLWSKGIGSLMELLKYAQESAELQIDFDMYGGGPDLVEAEQKSTKLGLSMTFHGPVDHAALATSHKIFVNPSLSEVLCTTVAEALAMGKFVVVPSHPSNDFFAQFPNCLTYANKEEFVGNLYYAITHSPEPLSDECAYALSWEAANDRFAAAGCITEKESEEFAKIMASDEGGVEVGLPPIFENEERREQVSKTVKSTRERYREFRSKLSQEIRQSGDILPADIQKRMLLELDKRLDVDVDDVLASPKLKLRLSPAELDKQLLEFYVNLIKNPGSDVFRTMLGGSKVGRQNFYLKQQAFKARLENGVRKVPQPQFLDDEEEGAATKGIKKTLRRNLQSNISQNFLSDTKTVSHGKSRSHSENKDISPKMSYLQPHIAKSELASMSFPRHQPMKLPRLSSRLPSLLI